MTCRDWFRCFKNNDFNVEDKEISAMPKKFEDEELEVLLHEDSCQAQSEFAELLGVDHTAISKHLKALKMIQKQGYRVPYKVKPRGVKQHLVNSWFNSRKGKVFCIISWPMMKNGYTTITLSTEDHGLNSAIHQRKHQSWISIVRSFCSVFGEISWV